MSDTTTNESAIRDLIRCYKICWEVWPECISNNGRLDKIGFDPELLGTHAEGTEHVSPGCGSCVEVYHALREVAELIVPRDRNLSACFEILPFEPSLRYASIRRSRPDVLLEMKIVHRNGLGPIDECEQRCLQRMQNKLDALGAYRGRWAPDPDYPSRKYIRKEKEPTGWETMTRRASP